MFNYFLFGIAAIITLAVLMYCKSYIFKQLPKKKTINYNEIN